MKLEVGQKIGIYEALVSDKILVVNRQYSGIKSDIMIDSIRLSVCHNFYHAKCHKVRKVGSLIVKKLKQ